MSSVYGEKLKISLFGQSHSEAVGAVIDGLPHGFGVDIGKLERFMERRAARSGISTSRREPDFPEIISGLNGSVTCGAPLCVLIKNTDVKSADYSDVQNIPRPSHADFTVNAKLGDSADYKGGGHLSGRLTAALCAAGGIVIQILEEYGINITAHLLAVGGIYDDRFDMTEIPAELTEKIKARSFPVINEKAGEKMISLIERVKAENDSVGGIIELAATGLKAGIGSPHFGGLENRLAAAIFGVPAVKAVEFGNGFGCAGLKGSENNDEFYYSADGGVKQKTNNCGGILGGISTGMPIILRAAVKPTPSIARPQNTVDLSAGTNVRLEIKGRHDPCIAHRAVPAVEAAAAIALLDNIL